MDADATERDHDARLAAMEARLRLIEVQLGLEASPPAKSATSAAPVVAPPALPQVPQPAHTYWSADARATWPPPAAPRQPGASLGTSVRDLEARLTGRALAWVGGIALVLGMIFFLSLAFSRGWITPEYRVLIGIIAGIVAIAGGAAFMERGNRLLGHVLTPVGLASVSISMFGATRLYNLIPIEVCLVVALAGAIAAAAIAIRTDSPVVAGFGLVSVLVAPPLLDAPADVSALGFVGVVLIGTTIVSIWRTWVWLPAIAFVLAAPQAAAWIDARPDPVLALAGLGAFWVLNAVAAGGEEFRRRRNDLSPTSATLLVANATFLVWAGHVVLSGDLAAYRGAFLVVAAAAHAAIGVWLVTREGERNLFGLLAIGIGIALLTMAAPAQLGAPEVQIAWTAEAVALTWLAVRRGHPYSAMAASVLYVLAAADLVAAHQRAEVLTGSEIAGANAALAFFAAGIAVGVLLLRDRSARSVLAALGFTTFATCLALRLDGLAVVVAMTALTGLAVAAWRVLPILPQGRISWQTEGLLPRSVANIDDPRPVLDQALPLTIVVLATVAVTAAVQDRDAASGYAWVVALVWTALGLAMTQFARWDNAGRDAYRLASFVGIGAAALVAVLVVAPPTRFTVSAEGVEPIVAAQTAIVLGVLVVALVALARGMQSATWRRWLWVGTGLAVFYLLSVAPVDAVATRVGEGLANDELRTQGQVALSVTWALAGVSAFVAGLGRRISELRQAGLALLGLAAAKVFVFDLASLEIAYRVISLMVLGLVLLASAGLWQRQQPRVKPEAERPPP